jgi:rhamnulokinase
MKHYLAIDMGAESGRAMLGSVGGDTLALEELHRFSNTPVRVRSGLYWDVLRLFHEIQLGLAAGRKGRQLAGVGLDTWGVDFALLDADGALIDNPHTYRDSRTNGTLEALFAEVPREKVFDQTGVQFLQINSLYQLYSMRGSVALERARTLLFIPDLMNYWLTGKTRSERTIASTSQFYNPRTRQWAKELLKALRLPSEILPELIDPGVRLGEADGIPVYTTGCHDTASAVAATPASGNDWCYISSGTWSLMGVELDEPIVNAQALALNLTNEIGAAGKVRFLKNIMGLWPLQECRRAWASEGQNYEYEQLARMAAEARPFAAVIDPDVFLEPGDMPARIAAHCTKGGQQAPQSVAEFVRTILESLALRYREVLEMIESLMGRRLRVIHIVGGGSRNRVLNQFVADATGRLVVAGPTEATAIGNVLIQAIGSGDLPGLDAGRALVRRVFPVEQFEPKNPAGWDEAYARFQRRLT